MKKKIAKLEVISPPNNPDVDSDFNTEVREKTLEHVSEEYGKDNVSNITTFGSLKAKGAFKAMCTIYEIPFSLANKVTSLIPDDKITLNDIFDKNSERYDECSDFRNATSEKSWDRIIDGARAIENRYKSIGMHACGIIMSSEPLSNTIPMQIRQNDQRLFTQWIYPECESIGLIKMDFLGLDTIDLIQHTIEYIKKSGKNVPNMMEIIHGNMDDKKVYEMIGRGETVGIFQLGGQGVVDLLKIMKPTSLDDIVATTALYRPGPMGMNSHIKYADRKNGREKIDYIDKEFENSPMVEILKKTYGLCIYQEQVMKIANQIAGMTLQEADKLRKAMGKKKIKVMEAMKPKFFKGAEDNGYSHNAVQKLWDTIEPFSKYAFNKSHSVAYAMDAYQAAYLKAYYPVEFMSALISQNVGKKDKILMYLKEAKRMGLKVGTVNINISDIKVSPDFKNESEYDIVYGISGIKSVSENMASIIIKERNDHGYYKTVQDLINRCYPLGVSNKKIYENLALSGAFDSMNVTRKSIIDNIPLMMNEAKIKKSFGNSLFDMMGTSTSNVEMKFSEEEYPFVEKLQKEANTVGLYLTNHPLSKAGSGISNIRTITIDKLLKKQNNQKAIIVGSITDITKKPSRRGGKRISINIDDSTGYLLANVSSKIVKGIDKKVDQTKVRKLYGLKENKISDDMRKLIFDDSIEPIDDLEENNIYIISISFKAARDNGNYSAIVNNIKPLRLSDDGRLPLRLRFHETKTNISKMRKLEKLLAPKLQEKYPGDIPISCARYRDLNTKISVNEMYKDAIKYMDSNDPKSWKDDWIFKPKIEKIEPKSFNSREQSAKIMAENMENLKYYNTKYKTSNSNDVKKIIERYLGIENYDYGFVDYEVFLDD